MNNQNNTTKKKKRSFFGFGKEKLKLKNIIERLGNLPDGSIEVYDIDDSKYKKMIQLEENKKKTLERRKELIGKRKPNVTSPKTMMTPDGNVMTQDADGSVTSEQSDNTIGDTERTSTDSNEDKGKKDEIQPIPSKFNFDSSINNTDQLVIKGVVTELNTILRLPELNLFSDKKQVEGEPGVVTIVETTIDETDGSEKQNIQKIMIPEFINLDNV